MYRDFSRLSLADYSLPSLFYHLTHVGFLDRFCQDLVGPGVVVLRGEGGHVSVEDLTEQKAISSSPPPDLLSARCLWRPL